MVHIQPGPDGAGLCRVPGVLHGRNTAHV
uniref:Uncharacterized protein n=1 Tax=Anguilla anguilla TaxID=7936 RepID=A0A0E9T1L2_ANGAN